LPSIYIPLGKKTPLFLSNVFFPQCHNFPFLPLSAQFVKNFFFRFFIDEKKVRMRFLNYNYIITSPPGVQTYFAPSFHVQPLTNIMTKKILISSLIRGSFAMHVDSNLNTAKKWTLAWAAANIGYSPSNLSLFLKHS